MNLDSMSIPPRIDPERVEDKGAQTVPLSAHNGSVSSLHGKMHHETPMPSTWTGGGHETRQFAPQDVSLLRDNSPSATTATTNEIRRDQAMGANDPDTQETAVSSASTSPKAPRRAQQPQAILSRSNSLGTSSTNETDRVFTPPATGGRTSPNNGSTQHSSQESQLLQLSQIAAAQERIPENPAGANGNGTSSRKRMADGAVKHGRSNSTGHARNTSAVSVASTVGSRVGELSAELKARLSYAMVKVNRGWQSHSIDQVETLASQAASPTSSTSTIHLRNGSSASPQLSAASHRASSNSTPATGPQQQVSRRPGDIPGQDSPLTASQRNSTSPIKTISPTLAPPVAIHISQPSGHPRRHSNPRPVPAPLSASLHSSSYPGPGSPSRPNGFLGPAQQRLDALGFSPHQNTAEKDAIESLLFMSSPGNSANLKHAFPTSTQPLTTGQTTPQRTALPTSRKSLPTARPMHHARSQSHMTKRVGFERSPMDMDIDEPHASPMSRGTPRRRMNGGHPEPQPPVPRLKSIPVPAGLSVPSKPRPALADDEIDRMLDRAAADSDSDGDIEIPLRSGRRDGAQPINA